MQSERRRRLETDTKRIWRRRPDDVREPRDLVDIGAGGRVHQRLPEPTPAGWSRRGRRAASTTTATRATTTGGADPGGGRLDERASRRASRHDDGLVNDGGPREPVDLVDDDATGRATMAAPGSGGDAPGSRPAVAPARATAGGSTTYTLTGSIDRVENVNRDRRRPGAPAVLTGHGPDSPYTLPGSADGRAD